MKLLKSTIVKRFAAFSLAIGAVGFVMSPAKADDFGASTSVSDYQPRSADDLQQLVGPVALYPDALLTQVFVASTYPDDVVAAAQYLQNGGDPTQAASFGWDASVQGLLQTPDVLNQLANDTDWMNQLGDAFLNQQQDVYDAVQSLRASAQVAGNLESNSQEQVLSADGCIEIIPTDPQVIYVPRYDPRLAFVVREGAYDPCVTFGLGIQVGGWLHEDYDWHEHRVYVGDWGFDRPWWRNEGRVDRIDYARNRPGVFVNNVTRVTNINNVTRINSSTWTRNTNKAAPRRVPGPVVRRVPTDVMPNPRTPKTPRTSTNLTPRIPTTPRTPTNLTPRTPKTPRTPTNVTPTNTTPRMPITPRTPTNATSTKTTPRIPTTPRTPTKVTPNNTTPKIPTTPRTPTNVTPPRVNVPPRITPPRVNTPKVSAASVPTAPRVSTPSRVVKPAPASAARPALVRPSAPVAAHPAPTPKAQPVAVASAHGKKSR